VGVQKVFSRKITRATSPRFLAFGRKSVDVFAVLERRTSARWQWWTSWRCASPCASRCRSLDPRRAPLSTVSDAMNILPP